MSEPTYRALCYSGADCLSGVGTYLPGTVLQGSRLFKRTRELPTGHCVTVVQTVLAISEPTYHALCYSGAGCLSNVRTYLPALCYSNADCFSNIRTYLLGTVLQWCGVRTYLPATVLQWSRLLKRCQNLPSGHCVTVVQTVLAMSEPTYPALCYRGAGCISGVRTYLSGTVLQLCRLFKQCQNLPADTVLQWCRLF